MVSVLGSPPVPPPGSIIAPIAATLAVTTTSANILLPNSITLYPFVNLLNDGTGELFFALGSSAVTASAADSIPIPAGKCLSVYCNGNDYVAAVGAAATTLRITQSNGPACPR